MDLEFEKKEKFVGFFLLSTFFLMFLSFALLGRVKGWFKEYVDYYSVFEESYNLQVGTPVKLYNAQIGKVTKILLADDRVRVYFKIADEYSSRVRSSSYVTVKSPTLIGSEFLALVASDKTSPIIPEGQRVPSIEKKSISDIMAEFQVEKTAKNFIKVVDELTEMSEKLNSPEGPLFSVLNDISVMVSDIEKGKGNVGKILRSSKFIDDLNNRMEDIEVIIKDIKKAVSKTPRAMELVNDNLEKVDKIGTNIEEGSDDFVLLIKDLRKRVKEIEGIIANIEKGSEDVPMITETAIDGIDEIRRGVKKADDAIEAIQKNFLIRKNLPERESPEQYSIDTRK